MNRLTVKKLGSLLVKRSDEEYKSPCFGCDNIGVCNIKNGEVCELHKAIEKLAEYEDLEEQGKLLKLPCATGSILYKPTDRGIISEYIVTAISSCGGRIFIGWKLNSGIYTNNGIYADEIGKSVFLTREEAKAVIKKEESYG